MNIKILVSAHKPYKMPKDSEIYLPIQVGCDETDERFGFQGDNTGDNISHKHRFYSELSAIYWAWRNLDADYIGSCHYRRYFISNRAKNEDDKFFKYILSRNELEKLLDECSVILPKKRKYYIETMESHYAHSHNPKDFEIARQIISDLFPDYLDAFNKMASSDSAHIFNSFIMRKDYFDQYCSFIFPILAEVEKRVDLTGYNEYEARICGYIAELLMDTWIIKNDIHYREVRFAFLEKQNWMRKIWVFLKRKFIQKARTFSV